jgi:NAD(P)-dependent dehydrogenase (short-subunit alcohol dehydrogenase family)
MKETFQEKAIAAETERPVALVTGALRGIGRACACGLARAGFNLVLNDLESEENARSATECTEEIGRLGAECVLALGDVADLGNHAMLLGAALRKWGRLDCLVNNAGISARVRGDLLDATPDSFDKCMAVNTRAVFFLSQIAARHMIAVAQPGAMHRSIINITSSNAKAVSITRGEYCVSKAASSMTTKLFALRLAQYGIGVYEVRPGIIDTEMTRPAKAHYDALIRDHGVPAERWGQPDDVASTVVCMAEGRLRYTVGQAVTVDGGFIMPRF